MQECCILSRKLLNIHPRIEIQNRTLLSTKKYRGHYSEVMKHPIRDWIEAHHIEKGV